MKIVYLTIAMITLALFSLPLWGIAKEWQSPCTLSPSQKSMIGKSVIEQGALKECIVFGASTIMVRYYNGHIGIFAIGDQSEAASTQKEEELHEIMDAQGESGPKKRLPSALADIWHNPTSFERLSPEDLVQADALVQELFTVTSERDIQPATYNLLGLRGNRYLSIIERLSGLSPEAAIAFYDGYIGGSMPNISGEDVPNDEEKKIALEKIIRIVETTEPNVKYHFAFDISREIERVDPDSYARLKKYGVVIDGNE